MATQRTVSPGGALLRTSRMFAIPPPLPKKRIVAGRYLYDSETATTPHPTHLTITTPDSSLYRGDWGLKRPLPLHSTTKTTTPMLRLTTLDTLERVTEYESAADHSLTLKKWQEMQLPLSTPSKKNYSSLSPNWDRSRKSVFEDDIDYTAPRALKPGQEDKRWKFEGPWLAGQTDLEFHEYLKRKVRRRRDEFHQFLREQYVRKYNTEERVEARAQRRKPDLITTSEITDERFTTYLKELRARDQRNKLFNLVRRFLDLPPSASDEGISRIVQSGVEEETKAYAHELAPAGKQDHASSQKSANPYADSGPPPTHPSAGLSYLRTASFIENHPLFGPQEVNSPIPARIIQPRDGALAMNNARLGVAGMVANPPSDTNMGRSGFNISNIQRRTPGRKSDIYLPDKWHMENLYIPGIRSLEPRKYGGSKAWMKIDRASLDAEGKVVMVTTKTTEMSVKVVTNMAGTEDDPDEGLNNLPVYERPQPLPERSPDQGRGAGNQYGMRRAHSSQSADEVDAQGILMELLASDRAEGIKRKGVS